ncbi:unnamed protein product [Sphagnum troendelagicum]|uniref:Uncharacterized protein n=1 Tax=Sphagnum troendelagicum TaxID=128251 RepID=A0ABP0THX5_9BRYO
MILSSSSFHLSSRSGSMGFVNERGATVDDATGSRRCTRTGKPVDILKSIVFAGVVVAAAPAAQLRVFRRPNLTIRAGS